MSESNRSGGRYRSAGNKSRFGKPQHKRKFSRGGKRKNNGKQYIHPSKFINKAKAYEEVVYEAKHKFADFPFGAQLQANIAAKGYETPSAIQDQAIPEIIAGKDVIGLANTGTGKTAAFLLPILERQSGITLRPSVLIVAPTRELAQQIEEQAFKFSKGLGVYSTLVVGGMNMDRQIRALKRRPHIIIGTPGRLKDLLARKAINFKNMTTLVLDEADRMLDMGFLPDIKAIVEEFPKQRQTLFFSATITPEVEKIANEFLNNPTTVSVRTGDTSDHVEQDVVEYNDKDHKYELLTNMLSNEAYEKVLVFGDTKYGVQRLSDQLDKHGIPSAAIHGNKTQSQRQRALKKFHKEEVKVLVATDVAARGLDIPNVTHVINYDTPQTYEDYVHRIGRTGRGGARGNAHTFIEKRK